MDWPQDADGDVLRRLENSGFDFSQQVKIDFEVSLANQQSLPSVKRTIEQAIAKVQISTTEYGLTVQVGDFLTYAFVMGMQAKLSELAGPFGGSCDEWGVLVAPSRN